jgi:hypothetical protein
MPIKNSDLIWKLDLYSKLKAMQEYKPDNDNLEEMYFEERN